MQTQPDNFDEFLQKINPLLEPLPLYRSLDFAGVAARRGSDWILISGRAVLSVEPCAPGAQLTRLVRVSDLLALSGRIRAEAVHNLVANMRDSWVIKGMESDNVRLTWGEEVRYNWPMPVVLAIDDLRNPLNRWGRAFELSGHGPSVSDFLTNPVWERIDAELRRSTPQFSGFDGLCGKLGLLARRADLISASFELSAELPVRFARTPGNVGGGVLEVDIDYVGAPELMIEWLPQYDLERVPLGWKREPTDEPHHVSRPVPSGATRATLILSFAELDAYKQTVDIVRESPKTSNAAPKSILTDQAERWKAIGLTLGEGGQAQVSVVEDTRKEHGGRWALKRLKNVADPEAKERFGREVKTVQSINHPNILRIIFSDLAAKRPYFVAEYCEGGSLQKIGASRYKADIGAIRKIVLPILDALVAAHKEGVIHRDVKPPNILMRKDDTPVIGDFGICFIEGGQQVTLSNEGLGSRNFIAPEMESGHHGLGEPSNRTDVYSLGKVIYWMLSGGNEFAREDYRSLADLLNEQRFVHVDKLLEQMVVRDPAKRIQSHEVKEKLEMTFSLVEGDFAPLAPSIGIRCRFCGVGAYERTSKYKDNNLFSGLGLNPQQNVGNGETALLRCTHCGYIEFFQLKGIACKDWWDR